MKKIRFGVRGTKRGMIKCAGEREEEKSNLKSRRQSCVYLFCDRRTATAV